MTDAIDLFSKKTITEIEEDKEKQKEHVDESFNANVEALFDQYLELCEDNNLSGLMITGVTPSGLVAPKVIYKSGDDIHKLTFCLEEGKIECHETMAQLYGLRDYEFLED